MRAATTMLAVVAACSGSAAPRATGRPATPDATPATAPAEAAPAPPVPGRGISLAIKPDDASVEIDDEPMGIAKQLAPVIELEQGLHTLVVTRDGYKPYRIEFTVTDRVETFKIRLEPVR